MFGVGATIGTGIFIVLSEAVPEVGPAVVLSLVLAGITAALTAVCSAELASTIPVSGLSYSYTYATMGEIGSTSTRSLPTCSASGRRMRSPCRPATAASTTSRRSSWRRCAGSCSCTGVRESEHHHGAHRTGRPRPVHRHRLLGILGRERPAVRAVRGGGHRPRGVRGADQRRRGGGRGPDLAGLRAAWAPYTVHARRYRQRDAASVSGSGGASPHGYRPSPGTRLGRVTCAFSGSTQSRSAFEAAAQPSMRHGVPLRLITFIVRDHQMYPSLVGYDAEGMVAEQSGAHRPGRRRSEPWPRYAGRRRGGDRRHRRA